MPEGLTISHLAHLLQHMSSINHFTQANAPSSTFHVSPFNHDKHIYEQHLRPSFSYEVLLLSNLGWPKASSKTCFNQNLRVFLPFFLLLQAFHNFNSFNCFMVSMALTGGNKPIPCYSFFVSLSFFTALEDIPREGKGAEGDDNS